MKPIETSTPPLQEAQAIATEDVALNRAMGAHGERVEALAARLRKARLSGRTVTVKVRLHDFGFDAAGAFYFAYRKEAAQSGLTVEKRTADGSARPLRRRVRSRRTAWTGLALLLIVFRFSRVS